ncbi:Uncharacterised protein [Acetobacterium wieringae]|nr:Uncharacterised protein [Acetobacterium wieringae]
MIASVKKAIFKFKPFSNKKQKVLTKWMPESPAHEKDGIIADGAVRSGKPCQCHNPLLSGQSIK